MEYRRAGLDDLDLLAPLFDAYRQFYQRPSDPKVARDYLAKRLARGEAVVFLAVEAHDGLGFTLLYPTFSSLDPGPILILYDLFVTPAARSRGVGRELMECARRYAQETGARRIELSTAVTNRTAQRLYQSLGYQRDEAFYVYALKL